MKDREVKRPLIPLTCQTERWTVRLYQWHASQAERDGRTVYTSNMPDIEIAALFIPVTCQTECEGLFIPLTCQPFREMAGQFTPVT